MIISNSLDIDFIHGYIQGRSCKEYMLSCTKFEIEMLYIFFMTTNTSIDVSWLNNNVQRNHGYELIYVYLWNIAINLYWTWTWFNKYTITIKKINDLLPVPPFSNTVEL